MPREIPFREKHVVIPFPASHVPNVDVPIVQQPATNQGEHGDDQVESGLLVDDTTVNEVPLRRSRGFVGRLFQMIIWFFCRSMSMMVIMLLIQSLIKKQFIVLNSLLGNKSWMMK